MTGRTSRCPTGQRRGFRSPADRWPPTHPTPLPPLSGFNGTPLASTGNLGRINAELSLRDLVRLGGALGAN